MCESSGRLVAWMDGELAADDAANLERHVPSCGECRERVSLYEATSREFAAFYAAAAPAATVPTEHQPWLRWVPALVAAAAVVALLLVLVPRKVAQDPPSLAVAVAAPAAPSVSIAPRVTPVAHRHAGVSRKAPRASYAVGETAIQIAIPAEEIFPPGAMPEGVTYIANLSLAPDGSVQALRLQP